MYAEVMLAPRGIASPIQRMPTVCGLLPSLISSRSLLVRLTALVATISSASSEEAAVFASTTVAFAHDGRYKSATIEAEHSTAPIQTGDNNNRVKQSRGGECMEDLPDRASEVHTASGMRGNGSGWPW